MDYTKRECGCCIREVVFTYPEGQSGVKEQIEYCSIHLAAPELLEALKDAHYWFIAAKAYIPSHSATLGAINGAIAKTEGKDEATTPYIVRKRV